MKTLILIGTLFFCNCGGSLLEAKQAEAALVKAKVEIVSGKLELWKFKGNCERYLSILTELMKESPSSDVLGALKDIKSVCKDAQP